MSGLLVREPRVKVVEPNINGLRHGTFLLELGRRKRKEMRELKAYTRAPTSRNQLMPSDWDLTPKIYSANQQNSAGYHGT